MGKRSNFERNPRDYYPTPYSAVAPLFEHLAPRRHYLEPCAGNGALIDHLATEGHKCVSAWDIEPQRDDIDRQDAMTRSCSNITMVITNPPWDRKILHPMIHHFRMMAPTWLLIDADWMHTKQAAPYLLYCDRIISIGRVKWIAKSKNTGKDNCCWYSFQDRECITEFYGR